MGRMRVALWVKKWNTELHTATVAPHVLSVCTWSHNYAVEPECVTYYLLQTSLKLASSNDRKSLVLFNLLLCYVISSRLQHLVSLEIRCLVKFFHTPCTIFLKI